MFVRSTRLLASLMAAVIAVSASHGPAPAAGHNTPASDAANAADRLKVAYPGLIENIEGNDVVFADGTRLPFDDGTAHKSFSDWLATPDIEDMFRTPYVPGDVKNAPVVDGDPGRARNGAFFGKIYGDCRSAGFAKSLVDVVWLPKKSGQILKVSKINGAAGRLKAVSLELDALPDSFDAFLFPSAGTFNCRAVAGTKTMSAHGYGIAIDIALKHAHYWRWTKAANGAGTAYKNEIPFEIVRIFEKHGFIWGGKWYHYDTMHFEYRPELLPPEAPLVPAAAAPNQAQ